MTRQAALSRDLVHRGLGNEQKHHDLICSTSGPADPGRPVISGRSIRLSAASRCSPALLWGRSGGISRQFRIDHFYEKASELESPYGIEPWTFSLPCTAGQLPSGRWSHLTRQNTSTG